MVFIFQESQVWYMYSSLSVKKEYPDLALFTGNKMRGTPDVSAVAFSRRRGGFDGLRR